jgi:tetratricopeptide (TPR) repeat protein
MKKLLPLLFLSSAVFAQDPKFSGLVAAGDAKYQTKSYKLAYADYDNALKLISADLDKMVAEKKQITADKKEMLNALVKHARCAYYTSNTAQVNADVEKLTIIDSANADAKALKAHAVYKSGNKVDGCRGLKTQEGRGSDMAGKIYEDCFCWAEGVGQFRDANSAFSLARNEQALELINKAIEILPDSLTYWTKKAEILSKMSNYKDAIGIYSYVIKKDPNSFRAWYMRGQTYLKFEKADSAFRDLSECIKMNSFNYDAYYMRAQICEELKEYQSAIYDYHQCIRLKPEVAELHYKVGLIKKDDIQDELGGCEEFMKAAAMGFEEAIPYAEECKHPKKKKK